MSVIDSLVGQNLGPYRILNRLNEGGAGVVYRAYQPSMERYVAVKVLKVSLAEEHPDFVERFTLEARTVAQLQHPHILPVIDFGKTNDLVYLVMVLLEGGTLRHLLRQRDRLSLDESAYILAQVASALERAHDRGIVHRDIKPENILMDEDNNCYLTDFGLARMIESSKRLTAAGMLLGTPHYLSPEQAKGEQADVRSDVYALGVMLYEMVTGHLPFTGEQAYEIVLKHITDLPPSPRELVPDLPEAVAWVLERGLAKDPAARFQTALELAEHFVDAIPQMPAASADMEQQAQQAPLGATESSGAFLPEVADVETVLAETPGGAYLTPTPARLSPQRMRDEDKITITNGPVDEQSNVPTLNAYMHYALRALEEVAGLQATEIILRFAGMESLLDWYPPNNLKLNEHFKFQDFSNLNHALVNYYGASGKEAAMHIGRKWAHYMFMEQPFFGITNLALRVMPTVAALRLTLSKGSDAMARIYRDNGIEVQSHLVEKDEFFLMAIKTCPCCVGKQASQPICWIWEGLFIEGGYLIKNKPFPVKEVACRAQGDPYCVWRIGKKPLE